MKRDRLRFLSHHDLLRIFERALRRAGLKVSYSQGFNPRPKLTFALALPLGVESRDEIVDIELDRNVLPQDLLRQLGEQLPPDLAPFSCDAVAGKAASIVDECRYEVEIPPAQASEVREAVARYESSEHPAVVRSLKGRTRDIALKEYIGDLRFESDRLSFSIRMAEGKGCKPFELLAWLGLDPAALRVVKTATSLRS